MTQRISASTLQARLLGDSELALLDVREQGVHFQGHPFYACSLPLSHLELRAEALLPRRSTPIVLIDNEDEGLAQRAAAKLSELGYTDVSILDNGCAGWRSAGGELFSGVNVPSKAFGEYVEHQHHTPRIPASELKAMIERGEKLVILDSRPFDEYHRMNIPGGVDVPGAELAYRVHDLAPQADTLVVVNCAGRTRSIIGCQSLRNAGIANKVVALKDGTMGWELDGYECERGSTRVAPPPSNEGHARAIDAAQRVAQRFQVRFTSAEQVQAWAQDETRVLYLLDVRTREEFERLRIAGSRHAPGGQLVQATDEFIAVRNARLVLIDPQRVRSIMTASWLNQMGLNEVFVLEPSGAHGLAGWPLESGSEAPAAHPQWPGISAAQLREQLNDTGTAVVDLSTSLEFRTRHIPGAWWAVRARLDQARERLQGMHTIVLTAREQALAHFAAPEAKQVWPMATIVVLDGGNAAWFDAGYASEAGIARATSTLDDIWYKPYEHGADYEEQARAYLTWEVALVEQIARDPTIRFRAYD
jgi:rhodanese-related sulfurtransferase